MNFLKFISDRYVSGFAENHWDGLIMNKLPLIRKLNFRLVTNVRAEYGSLSDRHQSEMIIPNFVNRFGKIPYVELSAGIENIAKFLRIDFVYRVTHQLENTNPFGVMFRFDVYF